jgi:tetratricopeptide (TPR) repeat protein
VNNFFNNGNSIPEIHNSFQFQNFYNELNNTMAPVPVPTVPNMIVNNTKPSTIEVHRPAISKMDNWANDFINEANNANFVNEFNQIQTPQQLQPFNNLNSPLIYQNPIHQFQFQTPYATMLNSNITTSSINTNKQANINKQELDEAFENAKIIANNETEASTSDHIEEEAEKWVNEFSKQQEFKEEDDEDLAEAARLVLDSVQYSSNPKFRDSKFMDFMKQIRDHEVTIKENKVVSMNENSTVNEENKQASSTVMREQEPLLNSINEIPSTNSTVQPQTSNQSFMTSHVSEDVININQQINTQSTNNKQKEENREEVQNNELNIDPVELTEKLNAMHKERMDELHEMNINTKEEEMEKHIQEQSQQEAQEIQEHSQYQQQQTAPISYGENIYNEKQNLYDGLRFGDPNQAIEEKEDQDDSFEMPSPVDVWEENYTGYEEAEWANYFMGDGEAEEPVMSGDSYQRYVAEEIRKEKEAELAKAKLKEQSAKTKEKEEEKEGQASQYLNNSTYDNASINLAESSYLQQQNLNNGIPVAVAELSNLMRDKLDINSEVASTSTQYQDSQRGQETDEEILENFENEVIEEKQYSLEDWVRDYQNNIKDIDIDSKNKEWAGFDVADQSETSLHASENLYNDYIFQKNNPFILNKTIPTLEEALNLHNLVESILALEAIVQTDPQNANAWLQLGNHQQENEREPQAISALKKAVELNPKLLDAWMSLAISYSNEDYIENAYDALESWILNSDKYNHLLKKYPMFMTHSADRHKFITDLLLECARFNPGADLDPDVQIGLGLLFNLSGEYDKAIDCFEAAITKRPMDHILYNRLGAMLANNNEPQKAIEAYFHALEINPSYIRARYNLAISCMNINEVKEAIEHLLGALSIQSGNNNYYGEGIGDGPDANSTSVWETLRTALITLGRKDLLEKVDSRDLESFRSYFDF